jgi:hypothetical protein
MESPLPQFLLQSSSPLNLNTSTPPLRFATFYRKELGRGLDFKKKGLSFKTPGEPFRDRFSPSETPFPGSTFSYPPGTTSRISSGKSSKFLATPNSDSIFEVLFNGATLPTHFWKLTQICQLGFC